jgi:undecaprenyl-diphosphatase
LNLLEAMLLGIVQGLTEFLPISSSGHLVLIEFLLKIKLDDLSYEVFVHFGTLFSVLLVFRRTIGAMFKAVWFQICSFVSDGRKSDSRDENAGLFWLIIVGSIPAGLAGMLFKSQIEKSFGSATFAAIMLLVTGTVLFLSAYFRPRKERMNFSDAGWVGISQALAILPGISRSGITISAGIFRGVDKSKAAEFSFLLSLPAILGASMIELREVLINPHLQQNLTAYFAGAVAAFGMGYIAIKFLLGVIKKGKFQYFAYYCFAAGIFFLIFLR